MAQLVQSDEACALAQMELENVTLASEIQALKDQLMLGDVKTEKEHFDQTVEVIHNLVESQKQEIASCASENVELHNQADASRTELSKAKAQAEQDDKNCFGSIIQKNL